MKTQPTPNVTRDDVLRVIRRDFSEPESEVLAILDLNSVKWGLERDRVQLAILKLAAGDFEAMKLHIDTACCDYRDVLVSAEYPAFAKHGWNIPLKRKEEASIYKQDWDQYQHWLTRK